MGRKWRSRVLGTVGVGALVVGAGLVATSPASAAPIADADALRAAVTDLNGTGPTAEIELLPGVVYTLPGGAGCDDENGNESGDLDIKRANPLKIFTPDGQAPAVLEMSCDAEKTPQRVIHVLRPDTGGIAGTLTLRNVVVRNGHAPDGGIGQGLGGGVLATGDVALENVAFQNNTAGDGGPGSPASDLDGRPGGFGGAVAASGAVTVDGSTFVGNQAGNGGDGVSQTTCSAIDGGAGGVGGQGGAVLAFTGLTITNSTFIGNHSGSGGNGGTGGCGIGNTPAGGAGGDGGVAGSGGAVQCGAIIRSLDSPLGCRGPLTVQGSTFSGNSTGNGGNAGDGGDGARAGVGGAGGNGGGWDSPNGLGGAISFIGGRIEDAPTTLLVENSTLDGNSSGNGGAGGNGGTGGPAADGGNAGDGGNGSVAGAVAAWSASESDNNIATLVHVTATDNGGGGTGGGPGQPGAAGANPGVAEVVAAAVPGQAGDPGFTGSGSVAFLNPWTSVATVIATSDPGADGPDCWFKAANSTISRSTDADIDENGCGFGAGSVATLADYALGPLANNGGPTDTRLPAAASALIDKATGVDGQLAVDQRGVIRPQAAGADIGAVEVQLIDLVVTKTASATSVAAGTAVTFTMTAKNAGTSSPQPGVAIADPRCPDVSTATGDANANNTLDPGETFSYTCTATLTEVGTFTNTFNATITDGAGVAISRSASVDVEVTAGAGSGSTPPLAKTGANNPTPELLVGGWLIVGGMVLILMARPRRVRVRVTNR